MQQVSGRTFLEPRLILSLILAFALGAGIGLAGWVLFSSGSSNGSPPTFLFVWIPMIVGILLRKKNRPRSRLIRTVVFFLSFALLVLFIGVMIGGGIASFMLFGVLGPLLALTGILLLAWGIGPYRKQRWLLALTCGLVGALGALIATEVIATSGLLDARFIAFSGLALAACGLAAELLRHLYETTQEARQQAAQPAVTPAPASHHLSRRAVLLGLTGGSALVATGAGFSWLTRAYLAHFTPLLTYKGHNASVLTLAWSPDGSRIASGSKSGEVQVWYAANGSVDPNSVVGELNFSEIDALAWSPDSQRLLIAGNGQIVEMQDTNSAQVLSSRPVQNLGVGAVATWSPDGSAIAFSYGAMIEIWSLDTGQTTVTINTPLNSALVWSPNGRYLASSSSSSVEVRDAQSGAVLIEMLTYNDHTGQVTSIAWSPDGKLIAAGDDTSSLQVWSASTGKRLSSYSLNDNLLSYTTAIAWSPDGRRIASGGNIDGSVQVWDALTGRLDFLYLGHKERVNAIAWSPDGSRIASGGDDQTVQVWQPE